MGACTSCISKKASSNNYDSGDSKRTITTNSKGVLVGGEGPSTENLVSTNNWLSFGIFRLARNCQMQEPRLLKIRRKRIRTED